MFRASATETAAGLFRIPPKVFPNRGSWGFSFSGYSGLWCLWLSAAATSRTTASERNGRSYTHPRLGPAIACIRVKFAQCSGRHKKRPSLKLDSGWRQRIPCTDREPVLAVQMNGRPAPFVRVGRFVSPLQFRVINGPGIKLSLVDAGAGNTCGDPDAI